MKLYTVTFHCPHCGQVDDVVGGGPGLGLAIPHGPDHAGTVAQLWPSGNHPPSVASLQQDKVWCDALAGYVELAHPARLVLTPPPAYPQCPHGPSVFQ